MAPVHYDSGLVCTQADWHDILLFILANYVSHAFTVKAYPGETSPDTALAIILALLFPYTGIVERDRSHPAACWGCLVFLVPCH